MVRTIKKALQWSAFFIVCCTPAPWVLAAQSVISNCPDLPISGPGQIEHIYDGDTVKLTDGRKIRLLGINSPEINYRHGNAEPFAKAARRKLQSLVPIGTQFNLQVDAEKYDRYGRLLAHLQLADGTNPALTLLEEGLATILILPPNIAAATCFAAAERQARNNRSGLWGHADYQPRTATDIAGADNDTGYQVITNRVSKVAASKRFYYLALGTGLTLRVNKQQWREYFTKPWPPGWPGMPNPQLLLKEKIQARGWITLNRQHPNSVLQMRLYHPAGLELLP